MALATGTVSKYFSLISVTYSTEQRTVTYSTEQRTVTHSTEQRTVTTHPNGHEYKHITPRL